MNKSQSWIEFLDGTVLKITSGQSRQVLHSLERVNRGSTAFVSFNQESRDAMVYIPVTSIAAMSIVDEREESK